MNKNDNIPKKNIIYSKVKNINKNNNNIEVEKNNNEREINNKINNVKKPKKDYEIRKENNINYKMNSNKKANFAKYNEINREVSLDFSNLSSDKKSKSKSKEKSSKKDTYEVSNVNDFTIIKSIFPKDIKNTKEEESIKKNNIITNININNYSSKKEPNDNNRFKKITKKSISKDKKKKKDKSKPKYNFQINLKDLINEDIKEKSKISPNKRYADIEMRRRAKNKKEEEFIYNKPFRFNMNDDY